MRRTDLLLSCLLACFLLRLQSRLRLLRSRPLWCTESVSISHLFFPPSISCCKAICLLISFLLVFSPFCFQSTLGSLRAWLLLLLVRFLYFLLLRFWLRFWSLFPRHSKHCSSFSAVHFLVCSNLVSSLFFPPFPSLQSALLLATLGVIFFFCFWAFGFVVISIYPPTVKALLVVFPAVHFNLVVSFSFSFLFFSVFGLSPGLTTVSSISTLLLLLRFWFCCDLYLSPCCWSIARLFLPVKQSV